ncbi:4,5-DOPA dioxygenase extradiol [Neisseriaceae bacterium B1]
MNFQPNRMPAFFLGHGSPMNVLQPELSFNQNIAKVATQFVKPKVIVCISAHWYDGLQISGSLKPETIHDFYGFPDELYRVHYPASGSLELAQMLQNLLPQARIHPTRGLDHGAWSVLHYLYPDADVPVVQLGLDLNQSAQWHYDVAGCLKTLREQGVLIVGSGNIVHNLRALQRIDNAPVFAWAEDFRRYINDAIMSGNHQAVIDYLDLGDTARLSVPTPEHFLPLLYVLAQADEKSEISLFNDEMVMRALSMTSVMVS